MRNWVKRAAVKAAFTSDYKVYKHGAVAEIGGSVIAIGVNKIKPKHHIACKYSLHAEVDAILKVDEKKIPKVKLYVARVTDGGRIANSKPCQKCQVFLKQYGVRRIYYSVDGINNWGTLEL